MKSKYRALGAVIALAMLTGSAQAELPTARPVLSHFGLQQLALTCTQLDRSIAFYRDKLGLPLLFVANDMAFFDLDGTRLMIAADRERPSIGRPTSVVYFNAPDFNASLDRLAASGAKLVGGVEAVQHTNAGDLKLQQFEDPDGNMLAIMGMVGPEAGAAHQ